MASKIRNYESEHTRFIREFLEKRPEIVEEQQKARALWWDRELDRDEQRRFRESGVPQLPYVYQTQK